MSVFVKNAHIVDVQSGAVSGETTLTLEGGVIRAIGDGAAPAGAEVLDARGGFVIPGLIDAHVHAIAYTADLGTLPYASPGYVAQRAGVVLKDMLKRGFTTVRDVGGADFGLAKAVEEGLIKGPRLLYGGKALSPSGGHGDHRGMGGNLEEPAYAQYSLGRRCDGVDEVRRAARDEIRRGAHHIKIMANGGISSPTDRITSDQFSEDEIRAIVDEAEMANLYVVSHTYTARSVARAVRCGVRSIEHGNLIDPETVALMVEKGAWLTPTLSIFRAIHEVGLESGFPADRLEKIRVVLDGGVNALELAWKAGIPMAYGTDLIGPMQSRQLDEFALRADVIPPLGLLQQATINGARLIRMEESLGQVAVGFRADLCILNANPLEPGVLPAFAQHLQAVLKDGLPV